jgi:hypothetical protein
MRCAQGLPQSPFFAGRFGDVIREKDDADADEDDDADLPEEQVSEPCEGEVDRMHAVEKHSEKSTELILRVLERTTATIAQNLADVWEAFGAFSRSRVGVSPEALLKACRYCGVDELMQMLKRYQHMKADEKEVEELSEALCGVWDRTVEK